MDFLTDFLSQDAKIQLQNLIVAHANRQYDYIRKVMNIDSYLLYDDKKHYEMIYLMDKHPNQSPFPISYNNDIIIRRIFVDKYTKSILNNLYLITEDIIPKSYLIDMILCHWVTNISESILNLMINLPIPDTSEETSYITIGVSTDVWKIFLKLCDDCEYIRVKDAFKHAIFSYVEYMHEINNQCHCNKYTESI